MSAKWFFLGSVGLIVLANNLRAEPPLPLDLVPEDACIGISVRNLADLRVKGDRLLGKDQSLPRPSQAMDWVLRALELGWPIDDKKPSALVCLSGSLAGLPADMDPDQPTFLEPGGGYVLGVVLTPKNLVDVAKAYKVKVADLKEGQVRKVPGKDLGLDFGTDRAGLRNGLIYLTHREKATAAWMNARSVRAGLPVTQQRRLDAADGLLYFGPPLLRVARKGYDPEAVQPEFGPQEAAAQRRLNHSWVEARQILAGFRIDDGLGLDLSVRFDPRGKQSQGVLKALAGGNRTSNLAGLPDSDRLLAAFAGIGLEGSDRYLARVLATDLWLGLRGLSPILDSDAVLVRRIFGDFYSRLKLGRAAVYQSSDPMRFGQLAAVAILEPTNSEQFLKEITQYVRLGNVEQFDPNARASKAEIDRLVAELGADEFETREAASTKLALIGDAALPALEKAEKSDDAEVHRRAAELRSSIQAVGDLRKQELAKGLVKKAFHPSFTLQLNAEKRAGNNVHLLGMRLEAEDAPFAAALKEFLGPQWNRVRLAVVNEKVLILLGSDVSILEQAIQDVREGKPGLEQSTWLAGFRKQADPERRFELHLALSRLRRLFTPANELPNDFKPTSGCSSISIHSGLTDLGMDTWIPADSVVDAVKWLRIW